ncbi:hypothetical protein K435DRAFT_809153 [Dendrothele bispora CBS 962.96]|uniref:Uncharacterized protein n=1 Tax=Dendrothele bispora (strain CBS 962.96) TaxID=1314807 RepID=A0A4S8KZ66_DENBC|nr:hypothetical protein K435DRAFT_809153 [Dendrothele bispora CBS 962.96]
MSSLNLAAQSVPDLLPQGSPGAVLGQSWSSPGAVLGQSWGSLGTTSGVLWFMLLDASTMYKRYLTTSGKSLLGLETIWAYPGTLVVPWLHKGAMAHSPWVQNSLAPKVGPGLPQATLG